MVTYEFLGSCPYTMVLKGSAGLQLSSGALQYDGAESPNKASPVSHVE